MTTERILSKKQTANDGILAKRRDSVWHFVTKSTGLKSVNPGKSSHFSESRNPSYVSWATCPECPRKEWRSKSFKLQSTPTGKLPKGRPWTRRNNCIFDLAWSRLGVAPAELSEIAVDREVVQVLLGLLPPRPSQEENQAWKWMKWMIFTLVYSPVFKSAQVASEQVP